MGDLQHTLVAWLLTYGLHSTALIGLVWFGVRCLPKESNLAQERLWKCALLGPILTASLQVGLAYEPLGGQLFLPEAEASDTLTRQADIALALGAKSKNVSFQPQHSVALPLDAIEPVVAQVELAPLPDLMPRASSKHSTLGITQATQPMANVALVAAENSIVGASADMHNSADSIHLNEVLETHPSHRTVFDEDANAAQPLVLGTLTPATTSSGGWPFWRHALLAVWAVGGLFGLVCLALAWRRIVDYITGRHELHEGSLFEQLQGLSQKAGLRRTPRLLVSKKLGSPATLGVLRPQICVPQRAVTDLSADQQEAMLGHELGHVVRRDPQWFFLYRLIERVLFFQPLNRIARREIQELAEYQCDDWAVKHTENGLGLARCLTEVAGWMVAERPAVALLPMAGQGSQLGHRVRRLLDEDSRQACARRNIWGLPLALGVFATGAMALPAVTTRQPVKLPTKAATPVVVDLGPPSVMSPLPAHAVQYELPVPTSTRVAPSAYPRLDALLEQLGARLDDLQEQIFTLQQTAEANGKQAETRDDLLRLRIRLLKLREQQLRMSSLLHSTSESKNTSTHEPKMTFNGQE